MGTRKNHECIDQVCIHCVAKADDERITKFIYLDSQGLHPAIYLQEIVDSWQNVEFELTGVLEEVEITEYTFCDEHEIQSYWVNLEGAGACRDLSIIQCAKQYIYDNASLFQNTFLKI